EVGWPSVVRLLYPTRTRHDRARTDGAATCERFPAPRADKRRHPERAERLKDRCPWTAIPRCARNDAVHGHPEGAQRLKDRCPWTAIPRCARNDAVHGHPEGAQRLKDRSARTAIPRRSAAQDDSPSALRGQRSLAALGIT